MYRGIEKQTKKLWIQIQIRKKNRKIAIIKYSFTDIFTGVLKQSTWMMTMNSSYDNIYQHITVNYTERLNAEKNVIKSIKSTHTHPYTYHHRKQPWSFFFYKNFFSQIEQGQMSCHVTYVLDLFQNWQNNDNDDDDSGG